ncbi:hypothetical protein BDW22DRAFT_607127 [Trametopsis cervina]|nr:hypothetical protein BDW22DRAFT_607127 [Trametopsis cervina]
MSGSSDDEAPEAFSFSSAKKGAKGESRAVSAFHAEEKKKQKEQRRERDRTLKERKAKEVGKDGKGKREDKAGNEDEEKTELEMRMERAMKEAQEEADEDEGSGSEDGDVDVDAMEDDDGLESGSEDEDEDAEMDSGSDSSESEDEEQAATYSSKSRLSSRAAPQPPRKLDYLPEHLFSAAFSDAQPSGSRTGSQSKSKTKKTDERPQVSQQKKRRRAKRSEKDIVVGYVGPYHHAGVCYSCTIYRGRTIRTLPSATQPSSTPSLPTALAPPVPTKRFLNRMLNVRGDDANAKLRGWQRRAGQPVSLLHSSFIEEFPFCVCAANVGVMKRMGPAAHFVRG